MALNDVFSGINDLLKQASDYAGEVMGSVNSIKDIFNPPKTTTPKTTTTTTPTTTATYDPNLAWRDFLFQPNYTLLFGGAALLIVALFMLKR